MLLIGREVGQGAYVGRGVRLTVTGVEPDRGSPGEGRAELTIEYRSDVVVSGSDVPAGDHVRWQAEAEARLRVDPRTLPARVTALWVPRRSGVLIGRGIRVVIVEVQADGMVRLGFDAPKHVAVSRDDFTLEDHLRFQAQRDGSEAPR